jgi:aspartokinase
MSCPPAISFADDVLLSYGDHTAVDLMAPNLNKEKVQVKAQMLRQIAKQESQSVQARDKAALEKQRYALCIGVVWLGNR